VCGRVSGAERKKERKTHTPSVKYRVLYILSYRGVSCAACDSAPSTPCTHRVSYLLAEPSGAHTHQKDARKAACCADASPFSLVSGQGAPDTCSTVRHFSPSTTAPLAMRLQPSWTKKPTMRSAGMAMTYAREARAGAHGNQEPPLLMPSHAHDDGCTRQACPSAAHLGVLQHMGLHRHQVVAGQARSGEGREEVSLGGTEQLPSEALCRDRVDQYPQPHACATNQQAHASQSLCVRVVPQPGEWVRPADCVPQRGLLLGGHAADLAGITRVKVRGGGRSSGRCWSWPEQRHGSGAPSGQRARHETFAACATAFLLTPSADTCTV
jgi:hypothetical protein